MITIIFEVWPKPEFKQQYLDTAASLLHELEQIDGFVGVERFESLTEPGKILSLSTFTDEDAVMRWRNTTEHRRAQAIGHSDFFSNYRLRVVSTVRDYGKFERDQAPEDNIVS